jgi:hypothetical protein
MYYSYITQRVSPKPSIYHYITCSSFDTKHSFTVIKMDSLSILAPYIQLNSKIKSTSFFAEIKSTFCYYINNRSSFKVKNLKYITYYTYYIIIVSKHNETASQKIWHQDWPKNSIHQISTTKTWSVGYS